MGEYILERVCKLECIDITQTKLNMCIDDQFSQPQNLSAKVEGISETRLLAFLGGQGPGRSIRNQVPLKRDKGPT